MSHKPFNIWFWNITHLFVTSVPCFQPSFRKIIIQNTWLYPRAVLRDMHLFEKSYEYGKCAQIFNLSKSVPYLRAMCSAKFCTLLIKNGRLRARFGAVFMKLWNFSKSHMRRRSAAQIFYFSKICSLPPYPFYPSFRMYFNLWKV